MTTAKHPIEPSGNSRGMGQMHTEGGQEDCMRVLKVKRMSSFWGRARGLLATPSFPTEFDAVFLEPCNAVHTLGMRYAIDVVFIDEKLKVLRVELSVPSGRCKISCSKAYGVLEMADGNAQHLKKNAQLKFLYL